MLQSMDPSAQAAWIALAISITGTICSPIISSIITNHHQIKLRKLDIQEKASEEYNKAKHAALDAFISSAGRYLVSNGSECVESFSQSFHLVYQYVPCEMWDDLDELYSLMRYRNEPQEKIIEKYSKVVRDLSVISKEPR